METDSNSCLITLLSRLPEPEQVCRVNRSEIATFLTKVGGPELPIPVCSVLRMEFDVAPDQFLSDSLASQLQLAAKLSQKIARTEHQYLFERALDPVGSAQVGLHVDMD